MSTHLWKYCSVDNSPVSMYISHPFWNQVVKICPLWLAPNLLTFGGMMLVMGGFALCSYYDYYLYASSDLFPAYPPVPNNLFLVLAVFTFAAHVMDGIDGKQARRTGTSGPTGELFDHGIDSWLTIPFTLCIFTIFGRADYSISAFRLFLIAVLVQAVFIITHWEKYNTGILFLSWGYDASQYTLSISYLAAWVIGYQALKFELISGMQLYPAHIAEILFYMGSLGLSIPMSLYNFVQSYRLKTGRQLSPYEAMLPLFSVTILFSTAVVWTLRSPIDIIERDPRAFMWMVGTIFSNITCRLIVSQMSQTRCEQFNSLLPPYLAIFTFVILFPTFLGGLELHLVRFLAICVTFAHIHYGVCVVQQMCEHFGINCFSIKKTAEE